MPVALEYAPSLPTGSQATTSPIAGPLGSKAVPFCGPSTKWAIHPQLPSSAVRDASYRGLDYMATSAAGSLDQVGPIAHTVADAALLRAATSSGRSN